MNLRAHLQSAVTVSVALLILAARWAGVYVEAPWWQALNVQPHLWWHLVPLGLMAAVMLLRIRRPLTAVILGLVCVLADMSIGVNLGILLCLTDLIYGLGIRARHRAVIGTGLSLMGLILTTGVLAAAVSEEPDVGLSVVLTGLGVLLMPLWWAYEVRRGYPLLQERGARTQIESERHAALLSSQHQARREAIDEERRHMASELHDVVSSQVSAIALTSGAVLNTGPDTERDRTALQSIRDSSVQALDDLGKMIRLLRGASNQTSDADEPVHWHDAVETARGRGMTVTVTGGPPEDLDPGIHTVLVRILQESLLNELKYGTGQADVTVQRRSRRLHLRVVSTVGNQTRGKPSAAPVRLGAGTGIEALQERVGRIGGRLTADYEAKDDAKGTGSRWVVEAVLPLRTGPPANHEQPGRVEHEETRTP